jgi:chromosome segregation protein
VIKCSLNRKKIQELTHTIQVCSEDIKNAVVKIQVLTEQVSMKDKELNVFLSTARNSESDLNREKETLKQVSEQLFSNQKNIQSLRNQLMEYAAKETETRNALHQCTAQQSTYAATRERLEKEDHGFSDELKTKKEERARLKAEHEALCSQNKSETDAFQAVASQRAQAIESLKKLDHEINQRLSEKTSTESRLQVLVESQGRKNLSHDRDELIKAAQDMESSVRGLVEPFSQHLRVQSGYERAVFALLESQLHSVLCKSQTDLQNVLQYIKENRLGSLTILIQNNLPVAETTADFSFAAIPALTVATLSEPYNLLLKHLLQNTWVVDSLEVIPSQDWERLSKNHRFVSKDGEILGFGLQVQIPLREKVNAPVNTDEIAKLTKLLHEHTQQLEESKIRQQILSKTLDTLNTQYAQQETHLFEHRNKLAQIEASLHFIDERLNRLELQSTTNQSEIQDLSRSSSNFTEQIEVFRQKIADFERLKNELTQNIYQEEEKVKQWSTQKEEIMVRLAHIEAAHRNEQDRKNFLEKALQDHNEFLNREREMLERREQEKQECAERIEVLKQEIESAQAKEKQFNHEHEQITEEIIQKKAERLNWLNKRSEEASKTHELQRQLEQLKEKEHQMQLTDVEISYQENTVRDRLLQLYKIDLNSIDSEVYLQKYSEETMETLVQKIEEYRGRVDSLGTVNLLAAEEYEELKTRYDFLNTQKQDIEQAREALLEAIRKINRTTKTLFEDTFNQVKTNFQEYFAILFGGGTAQLVLEDEQNPLESGIEIMVRPPGKKTQSITLLSGGEKALTATALLFALFKIKPSPFSVLDEIDAPLDEANIDRFLTVLRQFLNSTQFIIITHNRKTIAMADSLYGVTMEEPGVSKIVSVRLGQQNATTNEQLSKETSTKEVVVNTDNL